MTVSDLPEEMAALQPRLLRFANSLVHDGVEAEDLVQETYARALTAQSQFARGTNLRAWLATIMRNLYLSGRRRAAVRPGAVAFDEVALAQGSLAVNKAGDVERKVLDRAEVARIAEAFRSLPPVFAEPLRLVAVEDMSYAQVAEQLDIPIGSVMSRIYRARRLLAERLTETEP